MRVNQDRVVQRRRLCSGQNLPEVLTGGIFLLNGMAVGWSTKRQVGMPLSTMEAKFVAASEIAREMLELLGVREILSEIGMVTELPMLMQVDNQAAT